MLYCNSYSKFAFGLIKNCNNYSKFILGLIKYCDSYSKFAFGLFKTRGISKLIGFKCLMVKASKKKKKTFVSDLKLSENAH